MRTNRIRVLDLTTAEGALAPDAMLKLFSVMLVPESRQERLRLIRAQQDGGRTVLDKDAKIDRYIEERRRGIASGDMLLHAIELNRSGVRLSMRSISDALTDHFNAVEREAKSINRRERNSTDLDADQILDLMAPMRRLRSREALTGAWKTYRHVAHFWATVILREGGLPKTEADFFVFLDTAGGLALDGQSLHLHDDPSKPLIDREFGWRVKVPIN